MTAYIAIMGAGLVALCSIRPEGSGECAVSERLTICGSAAVFAAVCAKVMA